MNTPVSYPLARLLKEKDFPQPKTVEEAKKLGLLFNWYNEDGVYNANYKLSTTIQAPTISETVMWLYEKHGIWISVTKDVDVKWSNDYFNYHILSPKGTTQSDIGGTIPNSPTEAYEAAITYVLENLI
jgi:hypothetical protein